MAVGRQHSCDMSVQVFVHVPLLQAYFLGGGHMHKLCPRLTEHDKPGKCLSCELVTAFNLPLCLLLCQLLCFTCQHEQKAERRCDQTGTIALVVIHVCLPMCACV